MFFIIIRLIHLLMIQCEHQNIRIKWNSMNERVRLSIKVKSHGSVLIATTYSCSDFISISSDLTDNVSTRGLLIDLTTTPISSSNVLRFGWMKSDIREGRFRGWGNKSGGVDGGGRISKKAIKFKKY